MELWGRRVQGRGTEAAWLEINRIRDHFASPVRKNNMWAQCLRIILVFVLCSFSALAQNGVAAEASALVSFKIIKEIKEIEIHHNFSCSPLSSPPGGAPTSVSGPWSPPKGSQKNSGQPGANVEMFISNQTHCLLQWNTRTTWRKGTNIKHNF